MGNYSRIIAEVINRLDYQSLKGSGRILDGLKFRDKPQVNIDGLTDFPHAMLFLPTIGEQYHTGLIAGGRMNINIALSTSRAKGLVELIEWYEKLVDALEVTADGQGTLDTNLGGTTQPFQASLTRGLALDLSLNAEITIVVAPKPMNRGSRRT